MKEWGARKFCWALAAAGGIAVFAGRSLAGLTTEISLSDERQKEHGCSVAQRLGAGEIESGSLSAEDRLDLAYLKQNDRAEYDRCYDSGSATRREPRRRERASSAPSSDLPYSAKVVQVDDGNTLLLSTGQRVDLIGVRVPAGEQAGQAANFLRKLATNREVRIQYDQEKKDRFGRLQAYVFMENGSGEEPVFLNRAVIESGFAEALITPPNKMYERRLLGLAEERWVEEDPFDEVRKRAEAQIYNAWGMLLVSGVIMIVFMIVRQRLRGK
ncbi:MAG: thermonuclease family protein [Candidatus Omnitrophica bacterium]|nr:thermonuclease family protein [Candidatus Omnitrophota bacterium]